MQRSFNMLKEMAGFADIDLVTLMPRSKVRAYYPDFQTGQKEISESLSKYVRKFVTISHGLNARKLNKYFLGFKSLFSQVPYDVLALRSSKFEQAVQEALESNEYDVVYIDTIGLAAYVGNVNSPKIVNHHNIESQMLERRANNSSGILKLYFKWQSSRTRSWEKYWCNRVEVNLVCSELDRQRLRTYVNCEIEVIPNGVDIEYFKRSKDYSDSEVTGCIFAGGLEWYPNAKAVDFIVNELEPVYDLSITKGPVVICGKGWHKGLADVSKRANKIFAAGFVDDIRMPMEKAAIYVCPIDDGGGTKLKVLDALAMGIPLIAHPIACEGINVKEGDTVVFARTANEYVKEIEALMRSPTKRELMSRAGIRLIEENYSYSTIGKKIKSVIDSVTAEWSKN